MLKEIIHGKAYALQPTDPMDDNRRASITVEKNAGPRFISEHLANERTYLAWLRTSFSMVGLGIATNRFGYFLRQNGTRYIGIALIVMGIVLTLISAIRYQRVKQSIESQQSSPPFLLIWVVTGLAFVFALGSLIVVVM